MWQQAKWLCILGILATTSQAQGQSGAWRSKNDVTALARKIDQHIAAAQKAAGVVPAPPAEHGAFFRRLHLDLAGIIPTLHDVQDYIQNDHDDKLWTKTEDLLRHKALRMDDRGDSVYEWPFARHFAAVLRAHILNSANQQAQPFLPSFELWLKEQLEKDVGYDKIVHKLLSPGSEAIGNAMGFRPGMQQAATASPAAFYLAAESKAENLAGSASRVFLGVKLECAQCHAHPFAKWTKDEFWQFAAFFVGTQPAFTRFNVDGSVPQNIPASTTRQITIPGTAKVVKAKFLTGEEPKWKESEPTRAVLANWITSPKNPYFAKATADMVWQYFFGVSLLEPIMEPSDDSPITHPQLLNDLAQSLIEHDFDLKFLIRAIVLTQAYQRTSGNHGAVTKDDYVLFTRMPVRGMSPEQLFDSVVEAVVGPEGHKRFSGGSAMPNFNPRQPNNPRAEFLAKFANQDKRHESQTSILQALFMMNGKFLAEEIKNNRNLDAIATAAEAGSAEKRVATLYRMVLSREPRPEELSRLVPLVGGDTVNLRHRLGDILWALVNSAEFRLNH